VYAYIRGLFYCLEKLVLTLRDTLVYYSCKQNEGDKMEMEMLVVYMFISVFVTFSKTKVEKEDL